MPLQVELVSPERVAYSGEADMVIARVSDGDIAFLPGHVPFIGALQTHPVKLEQSDGVTKVIAVHQGFIEVSGDRVTILSDVCEISDDIDVKRAEAARDAAIIAVAADENDPEAKERLKRAEVRLSAAGVITGDHR